MDHSFLLMPLLSAVMFASVGSPLGTFVMWRRLSFFGDALAHGSLLGAALGLMLYIDPLYGVCFFSVGVSFILVWIEHSKRLSPDTGLAILSQGFLAVGIICLSLFRTNQVSLISFLLGDILSVTPQDVILILIGGFVVLGSLIFLWRPLLAITVHEEIAAVEGVPVFSIKVIFMVLLALTISLALKIIGVLLVTALMILPAASARFFAKTPEQMAGLASLFGVCCVLAGFWLSYAWDLPTAPSIGICGLGLFIISQIIHPKKGV